MKHVSVYLDQMQLFVIINKDGIRINADVNVKNLLIKVFVIKDMPGILVNVNVNVINHVLLVGTQIMKTVNVKKGWQINWQMNVLKLLMKQV